MHNEDMNGDSAPATRGDLKSLDAKLDAKIDRVAMELVKTQGNVAAFGERLLARMTTMEGKIDRRQIIMDYRVDELEKRVKTLENQ